MTAGYYKNHIDYNRHVSYGKSVSYGKHINYNKPSDAIDLCGFSTYSDGTNTYNVAFEYVAPLYLNGDYVEWSNPANQQTISAGWFHEIKITTDTVTAYFLNMSCSTTSAIMRININAGNLNIAGNDDTNTVSWFTFGGMLTLGDEYILRIEYNGTDFIYYKDGVEFDRDPITLAAGFTYDNVLWGARTPFLNKMEGLYFYGNDSNLGDFNFTSNQDDGLNVISSNSIIATIDDDIAGSSQIKPDGTSSTAYNWPTDTILRTPYIGPVHIEADTPPDALSANINFDPMLDDDVCIVAKTDDISINERWFHLWDSANTSRYIRVIFSALNRVYVQSQSALTGVKTSLSADNAITFGAQQIIGFRLDGVGSSKRLVTLVDGVEGSVINMDYTGTTFDRCVIGTNFASTLPSPDMFLFHMLSAQIGNTNFVGRLWGATDPDGNKYFSDFEPPVEFVLADNNPKGVVAPYNINGVPTDWPTTYLVSDSACPNNETSALLIDKDTDIALQDEDTAEFLFDKDLV